MEYELQATKVSENLAHAGANSKNFIFRCFPNPNTISFRDYQLVLFTLGFSIN